ncbi:SMI1/KNR4 family protein [Photobacterium damselae]|uniref:SMI1/KNR4 family protein n=1 Tax=Photobacterium damselae TaxID=38293 RepID=UPI002543DAFD
MNKLLELIAENEADTMPATEEQIDKAELELGLTFSTEYRTYLQYIGVISFKTVETYGLGVPETSFLNIVNALHDFKAFKNFPSSLIPLADIGDGHYYMYDNSSQKVLTIALPDLGTKIITAGLEQFLCELVFG